MKTTNSGRILMTPGVTVSPFSEAMPAHPQNGDEVIAVNVGSSTYTLTGSITGGDLVMDAGESAILVWAGATWLTTWSSGSGGVTYPITAEKGGSGSDLSGAADHQVMAFNFGNGVFEAVDAASLGAITIPVPADSGGTGADLSGLASDELIAFDGAAFAGVGINAAAGVFTSPLVTSSVGAAAHVAIGTGVSVDATINLTAILPGVVGNVYTVEIVSGAPTPDVALGLVEAGTVTTITLGTDGAGVLDPAKNTATLVLAELGASTLFTGALAGTGDDSLEVESQIFFGGAEAITASAGGASFANSTPSDTAEVAAYWSATDSGANTFRVRTGIELTTHPEVAPDPMGDWVLRTFKPGDPPEGIERLRVLGNGSYMVLGTATLISGSGDLVLEAAEQGNVTLRSDTLGDVSSQTELTINGTFSEVDLTFIGAGAGGLYISPTFFEPQDDDLQLLGNSNHQWNTIYGGTGRIASSHIGSGTDGTVNLVADAPGIAGNEFTATVAAGVGLNVPMTAAFTLQALLVTLGTDGAGALDPAKNTATLVAGAINTAAGGVTATESGTGADPLTGAEGPTTFTGGAESLTLAGGLSANANIYLTNLPGSDPGIPGALYQTAGAVMVSL